MLTAPPRPPDVLDAGTAAADAVAELVGAALWPLSDAALLEHRARLEALDSMLTAARLAATREIDARGAAVRVGATSTAAWLRSVLHQHPGGAAREVTLAGRLPDLRATSEALAAGRLPVAALSVIADTDAQLARHATAAQRGDAEAFLVEQAGLLDQRGLHCVASHLRQLLDPDHDQRLEQQEQAQLSRRAFRLRAQPDGRPGPRATSTSRPPPSCAPS